MSAREAAAWSHYWELRYKPRGLHHVLQAQAWRSGRQWVWL